MLEFADIKPKSKKIKEVAPTYSILKKNNDLDIVKKETFMTDSMLNFITQLKTNKIGFYRKITENILIKSISMIFLHKIKFTDIVFLNQNMINLKILMKKE